MLLKMQYRELLKYRNKPVSRPQELSYATRRLLEEGCICEAKRRETTIEDSMMVERILLFLLITDKGKDALEEYEAQLEQKRLDRLLAITAVMLSLLTLAATVLFGILALLH